MTISQYIPGTYAKRVPSGREMAEYAVKEWEMKRMKMAREKGIQPTLHRCVSFSRKIGVGAVEIADRVAEKLGMKVADREIMEHIARDQALRQKTVDSFDERYPGAMSEFASLLFGEKSFTLGDYHRYLVSAVYSLAEADPTVFVGRVSHLILPRDKVLAVRFIASRPYRVKRIAEILGTTENEAESEITTADKMQRDFFKKVFSKTEASPYEFDMVINRDYLEDTELAADLVVAAYRGKFGDPA